jgi:hypothetical protein
VGAVGGVAYLAAVRIWFPSAWRDLSALAQRVLPVSRARAVARRVPLLAGRFA